MTEEMRHDLLKSTRGKRNTSCVFVVSAHLDFLGSVWSIKTFFKILTVADDQRTGSDIDALERLF